MVSLQQLQPIVIPAKTNQRESMRMDAGMFGMQAWRLVTAELKTRLVPKAMVYDGSIEYQIRLIINGDLPDRVFCGDACFCVSAKEGSA
jgi:hypothetical protein